MAPRLIGWGVLALIGSAIWAVLAPLLRWLAFGIYWKINDSDYGRDMPGTAFSERWEAARLDWADLADGGLDGALSVLAAVLALRLVIVIRNRWQRAGETVERRAALSAPARAAAPLAMPTATDNPRLTGAWEDGAAIERLFPPPATPGLSHLGGLPIAGPGFIWPRGPRGVPNFVAQIDMADLPDFPARALFPGAGVLHFFLPSLEEGSFNQQGVGPLVAYTAGGAPTAEIAPPSDLPPHGDGTTGQRGRWPSRLRQTAHDVARGSIYPYHPVALRPVERDDRPEPSPLPGMPEREGQAELRQIREEQRLHREGGLIGPPRGESLVRWTPPLDRAWRPSPGFPSDWLEIDLLLTAIDEQLVRSLGGVAHRLAFGGTAAGPSLAVPDGSWPGLGVALDRDAAPWRTSLAQPEKWKGQHDLDRRILDKAERRLAVIRGEHPPHDPDTKPHLRDQVVRHEKALAQVADWRARAEDGLARDAAPDPEESAAVWALFRDAAEQRSVEDHVRIGPLSLWGGRTADRSILEALVHAAEERIASGRRTDPDLIAAIAARHAPGARIDGGGHGRHRIGGAPVVVQEAGELMIGTHVLLLQLEHDDPMGFRFGDAGVFQWWVKPDDLAARRWDAVELVFEGH